VHSCHALRRARHGSGQDQLLDACAAALAEIFDRQDRTPVVAVKDDPVEAERAADRIDFVDRTLDRIEALAGRRVRLPAAQLVVEDHRTLVRQRLHQQRIIVRRARAAVQHQQRRFPAIA